MSIFNLFPPFVTSSLPPSLVYRSMLRFSTCLFDLFSSTSNLEGPDQVPEGLCDGHFEAAHLLRIRYQDQVGGLGLGRMDLPQLCAKFEFRIDFQPTFARKKKDFRILGLPNMINVEKYISYNE